MPKYIAGVMALRASGRSSVTIANGPSRRKVKYGVPSQSPSGGRGLSLSRDSVGVGGIASLLCGAIHPVLLFDQFAAVASSIASAYGAQSPAPGTKVASAPAAQARRNAWSWPLAQPAASTPANTSPAPVVSTTSTVGGATVSSSPPPE